MRPFYDEICKIWLLTYNLVVYAVSLKVIMFYDHGHYICILN